jgi:hypothetical protein
MKANSWPRVCHIGSRLSRPLRLLFRAPSVDPLTRDLPGPRIEHQAHRAGPVAQERKAGVVAAIHEELVARRGDDRNRCTFLKIEDRQVSACLDQQLAVLVDDSKIGESLRSDLGADERQLDRPVLPLAYDPQANLGVDGSAYLLDRLAQRKALGRRVIEM